MGSNTVGRLVRALSPANGESDLGSLTPVDLTMIKQPLAGINVGLESFTASLIAQDAAAVQVDWRPPAGGNEALAALLERMKR